MSHATRPARPVAAGRPRPARIPALIIVVYAAAAVYLLLVAVPGYAAGLFADRGVPACPH